MRASGIYLLIVASSMSNSYALDIAPYIQLKKSDPKVLETYILGVGDGLSWADVAIKSRGDKQLFCPPGKLRLNAKNYMDLIDAELTQTKAVASYQSPIEVILLRAMQKTFPCEK